MAAEDGEDDKVEALIPHRPRDNSPSEGKPDREPSKKSTRVIRVPRKNHRTAIKAKPSKRCSKQSAPYPIAHIANGLFSPLGAGNLDPFGLYPTEVYHSTTLPRYVHEVIDFCVNKTAIAFVSSNTQAEVGAMKKSVMGNIMSDSLWWYTIALAGATHLSHARGETEISKEKQLLRLSYKTKALAGIREEITRNNGVATDRVLLAMVTMTTHGAMDDIEVFKPDRVQSRKAFSAANDVHYYTSRPTGGEHWKSIVRLIQQRGGFEGLTIPGLAPAIALCDILNAWRDMARPAFPILIPTAAAIQMSTHKPDAEAISYGRRLLSGIQPLVKGRWLFEPLMNVLKYNRVIIVDYNQYERKAASRPDLRRIHFIRHFAIHDLLSLPIMSQKLGGHQTELEYELCRLSCIAFNQLVIYPLASVNRMAARILQKMVPVIELWTSRIEGRTLCQVHPGLFLWAVLLAGMLATEHYEVESDAYWMDKVAAYFDRVSIKADKKAWPMVKNIVGTYLWLDSECDGPGQRAWNYACLYLAAREDEY